MDCLPISSPWASRNASALLRPSSFSSETNCPLGVHLRRRTEARERVGHDPVRAHSGPARALAVSGVRDLAQQRHHAQFLHQRRVEGNLVEPVQDLVGRARQLQPFARIDLHQNGVMRVAFAHQRRQRRIAGIAAVPVRFAVDLDRMEHGRQAGRGKQDVGGDLLVAEDVAAAGAHIGRGDEQLDRCAGQPLEIDALVEDGTQRVEAERIEIIGRHHAGHQVHGEIGGRRVERPAAHQAVERRALQRAERRSLRHPPPIGIERGPRAFGAALRPSVRHQGCIHRARRRAGDRLDPQPRLLDQPIEHAPGERAVGTAALQGEVHQNRFARASVHRHPPRPEMKRHLIQGEPITLRLDPS